MARRSSEAVAIATIIGTVVSIIALFVAIITLVVDVQGSDSDPGEDAQNALPLPSAGDVPSSGAPSSPSPSPQSEPVSPLPRVEVPSSDPAPQSLPAPSAPTQQLLSVSITPARSGPQEFADGSVYANQSNGTQLEYRYNWTTMTNLGPLTSDDCITQGKLTDSDSGQIVATTQQSTACDNTQRGWVSLVMPTGRFSLTVTVKWRNESMSASKPLTVLAG